MIATFIDILMDTGWFFLIEWITNIVFIITLVVVIYQIIISRLTLHAQAYGVVRDILQEQKVREARKQVFEFGEVKSVADWSDDQKKQAELVCHTYDSVGQMVRNRMLSKNIIINNWKTSLIKSGKLLKPLIDEYRHKWDAPELWDDFLWLANEANKRNNKNITIQDKRIRRGKRLLIFLGIELTRE